MTKDQIIEKLAVTHSYDKKRIEELRNAARALLKPRPDYASWIGGLVEVSRDGKDWVTRELKTFYPALPSPFITVINSSGNFEQWKFCRPYTKPLKLIFIPHDGGECPVGEDEWVIVKFRNGIKSMPVHSLNQGIKDGCYKPSDITGYMRIKL